MKDIIDELYTNHILSRDGLIKLLEDSSQDMYLARLARKTADDIYGKDIYIRGLIEFTNYCKNDCYYCGIRRSNNKANRYRLSKEQIIDCANKGYDLGFRTVVLQGGEEGFFTAKDMEYLIVKIKKCHPDMAITLSVGERDKDIYRLWREAGADRYLLRHETHNQAHYGQLHPKELSIESRIECLYMLKELGYQVGAGFMVGSPYQTIEHIVEDLLFIKEFEPEMVGIGPFIAHKDTPFAHMENGSYKMTLKLLSIIRLLLPNVLLPATTALGTINPRGREEGILAGANVVMPNLSPVDVRIKYSLYDNKICTGEEAAECIACLKNRVNSVGYNIVKHRGDHRKKA